MCGFWGAFLFPPPLGGGGAGGLCSLVGCAGPHARGCGASEHGAIPRQSGGPALSGGREVRLVEPLKARMGGRRLDPFAQ